MFACPGLIFYTVCSVPWLNGNLALAEKCSGPLRFPLRQVLLYVCETERFPGVCVSARTACRNGSKYTSPKLQKNLETTSF